MGKANKPLVVRIRPGETRDQAIKRTLTHPKAHKRNTGKILVRYEAK